MVSSGYITKAASILEQEIKNVPSTKSPEKKEENDAMTNREMQEPSHCGDREMTSESSV
jgi:hypothetical protein